MGRFLSLADLEERIGLCRGRWAVLDADLAAFYGMTTEHLLGCVRPHEPLAGELGFHLERGDAPWERHRRVPPYAFTEHGVVAVAFMVETATAIGRSVELVRVFARCNHGQYRTARLGDRWRFDGFAGGITHDSGIQRAWSVAAAPAGLSS